MKPDVKNDRDGSTLVLKIEATLLAAMMIDRRPLAFTAFCNAVAPIGAQICLGAPKQLRDDRPVFIEIFLPGTAGQSVRP